jgi:hypothetical protein
MKESHFPVPLHGPLHHFGAKSIASEKVVETLWLVAC